MYKYVFALLVLSYLVIALDTCMVNKQVGIGLIFFAIGTGILLWK